MSNTAASLVDRVIAPDLTLRQWVLTVPFELRLLLAAKPDALSAIGRIFIQEIQRWQLERARALGFERAKSAAVSFCQRFGSSLNLHVHWHVIVRSPLWCPHPAIRWCVSTAFGLHTAGGAATSFRRLRTRRRTIAPLVMTAELRPLHRIEGKTLPCSCKPSRRSPRRRCTL
jgi:diadenosine tetraphosphate (Ap4A) HIT family hydrolase